MATNPSERSTPLAVAALDVAVAWFVGWLIEAMLALLGLKGTLAWIDRLFGSSERRTDAALAERHRIAARRAYRILPFADTCLRRSLVEYWLGRQRDLGVQLVIGVRAAGGFRAHAWVVDAGHAAPPPNEFVTIFSGHRGH